MIPVNLPKDKLEARTAALFGTWPFTFRWHIILVIRCTQQVGWFYSDFCYLLCWNGG